MQLEKYAYTWLKEIYLFAFCKYFKGTQDMAKYIGKYSENFSATKSNRERRIIAIFFRQISTTMSSEPRIWICLCDYVAGWFNSSSRFSNSDCWWKVPVDELVLHFILV